jgi:YfiH family protein
MPFQEEQGLRYFIFEHLKNPRIKHGIFTRKGGVSLAPWQSLNLGNTVGDERTRVQQNKQRLFKTLDIPLKNLHDVYQVHGNTVIKVNQPRSVQDPIIQADGMITDQSGIALLMRFADCVPILFFDPQTMVIGIAHAGWKGTVKKVAAAVVEQMKKTYQVRPADIRVGIGPSIGPDHYQVGEDVISRVREAFPERSASLLHSDDDGVKLDLWKANQWILQDAGVVSIENSRICTACHLGDWYSHRAEKGRTGRFGALIMLDN